jgi:beta-lactamase regulating signal transducer with metallopeptidase domain
VYSARRSWSATQCVVCGVRQIVTIPTGASPITTSGTSEPVIASLSTTVTSMTNSEHQLSSSIDNSSTLLSSSNSTITEGFQSTASDVPTGDNTIVIIVAVLGGVVAVAIVFCIALVLRIRSKRTNKTESAEPTTGAAADTELESTTSGLTISSKSSGSVIYSSLPLNQQVHDNYDKGDIAPQ